MNSSSAQLETNGPLWERLAPIAVSASVRLQPQRMKFVELYRLQPGQVLEFDLSTVKPVRLMVSNKVLATGETVWDGQQLGFRVCDLSSPPATD